MNQSEDIDRPDGGPGEPPTEEAPTRELPPGEAESTKAEAPADAAGSPRRFLRSRNDRVIVGVAGGLGRYFNIDPVILRIAFAVSILFGGIGAIAYLAVALFVPSDDGNGVPVVVGRGRGIAQAVGIGLLAIAVLFGFGALATGAAFVTGLGYGLAVAAVIVVIGVALVALSFRGAAKWLIVPALALSIGVAAAAASDLDLKGGMGDRDYRPESVAAIPDAGYELGVGRLAVDLRGIDWSPKQVIDLDVRVGAGQAIVAVPSNVCVVSDAHTGAGVIRIAGQQADGVDVGLATGQGARGGPQLRINANADLGEIRVINDDNVSITKLDRFPHEPFETGEVARAANTRACAA
jgi:phage shock protein PspC (stress-responsive transcriptional regulator)